MLGLGVGIDYALFIVTRFRENLHKGLDRGGSRRCARYRRPGRRVRRHHRRHLTPRHGPDGPGVRDGLAAASATVVAVTAVASLTLLPALLGFAGSRIELTRWRGLIAAPLIAVGLVGVALDPTAGSRRDIAGRRR